MPTKKNNNTASEYSASQGKNRPKYVQVSELLVREINAGHWREGERLPVEADLANELQVAVGTLRKALTLLEDQGLLIRKQGSGTYVNKLPREAVYQLFRLELLSGGGIPHANILDTEKTVDASIAEQFQTSKSSRFWKIARQRFLNETVIAAEEIWIRGHHASELSAEQLDESLYRHYRNQFGFWISHVEDRIGATNAPGWVAKILGVQPDTSVGWIERLSWTSENRVEEYSRTWFNSDVCRYISRMS